jgi:hypothetical protein
VLLASSLAPEKEEKRKEEVAVTSEKSLVVYRSLEEDW